ncbi:hypothetical protein [Flavilitoribacter nigricans]|uniref:Uncharacterized protein n=1 Tax=Flavilitoribacter nigricans (strain ATCC 23147 / DSM 23189 / NBRC 102662 / NCIMB 1420 / SS-2) TaxID=1122177 RepID=A0A2D0N0C7_FLAN2|nr:hypothetical protein [Flavilitoribacter nigricans]PHN01917.1 hypothetical protein CRP01_34560 [Flavilitoribacter nigricans DSM 23189 = NBRC 102662]
MIKIALRTGHYEKAYLAGISRFHFTSFLDLVWEIFEVQLPEIFNREVLWEILLEDMREQQLDIPGGMRPSEFRELFNYYLSTYSPDLRRDFDPEKFTYLLLACVHNGRIIPVLDERVVDDLRAPLTLSEDSVLSFVDRKKINTITFSIL